MCTLWNLSLTPLKFKATNADTSSRQGWSYEICSVETNLLQNKLDMKADMETKKVEQ